MHRVKPEKYRADLAECRQQAAPQEAAARQARQQQGAGTGLAVAGAVASFVPVSTFSQARNLANATDAAQNVGGATAASGGGRGHRGLCADREHLSGAQEIPAAARLTRSLVAAERAMTADARCKARCAGKRFA
jgi:hypothetical protein